MTKKKEPKDLIEGLINAALKRYETDKELENEKGIDVEVSGVGTFTILRASLRNKKYADAIRKRMAPHIDSKDEELLNEINLQVFVDTIIVGLKSADGQVIEYNDEAKRSISKLLKNAPDLLVYLQTQSEKSTNFLKSYEAEAKN